jgi:antitoxin ParD1/3/4
MDLDQLPAECGFSDAALEALLLDGLEGDGKEWDLEAMRVECRAALAAARTL